MRAGFGQCGSNKMVADEVPLLLFFRESRNGSESEATNWLPTSFHCCFFSWEQDWELGGSSKMADDVVANNDFGSIFIRKYYMIMICAAMRTEA